MLTTGDRNFSLVVMLFARARNMYVNLGMGVQYEIGFIGINILFCSSLSRNRILGEMLNRYNAIVSVVGWVFLYLVKVI